MNKEKWPSDNDSYWIILSDGSIERYTWSGDCIDNGAFSFGNVFRTKVEAEFEAERLKVLCELEKMGGTL